METALPETKKAAEKRCNAKRNFQVVSCRESTQEMTRALTSYASVYEITSIVKLEKITNNAKHNQYTCPSSGPHH